MYINFFHVCLPPFAWVWCKVIDIKKRNKTHTNFNNFWD